MSGVIPDGLRMDSQAHGRMGGQKTAGPEIQAVGLKVEPVVGFEPTILPFTRQREVVHLRAAQILPVRKCHVSAGGIRRANSVHVAPCRSKNAAQGSCGLQKDSQPTERTQS